jgi:hypothetical protein
VFWRAEVARILAARRALDLSLTFAEWQYSNFLGALVEPVPSSKPPPRKRARTGASPGPSGKGKAKAIDVDAIVVDAATAEVNAEVMDEVEEVADAEGGDGVGAGGPEGTEWAGFTFGLK